LEGVQGLFDPSTSVKVAGKSGISQARMRLGWDASVAAGPVGAGAKAQTADVLAFSRTKAGVYGGLNIEGSVVNPKDNWNGLYYGQTVTPSQILVSRAVTNPKADPLRTAVAAAAR
jgi:lipid-binding SYLF domain-containing protein